MSRPHGIRGEFLVSLETDFPEWLAKRAQLHALVDGRFQVWQMKAARWRAPKFIAAVVELPDRTAVEQRRGTALFVTEQEAAELEGDPDFFYNSDLVGLTMTAEDGELVYGKVIAVHEMPAQNLLEVERAEGQPFLFPFVAALIDQIDLEAGQIRVKMPEGLVSCNDGDPGQEQGKG